ncbi:PREDICTED: uncharacterized protein LOC104720886 isoform X2 [Camelina sativa]|uniref:Uncharacterized protein LOC104720886 isoform X2 n=1 Tax=Camelina sativa TaxID=90675 RepID=A0ABM0U7E7_CAMSA|nr:PREDICTED: uncharacterized protein LOC104720886 isoform X2 [Camelina sativa]
MWRNAAAKPEYATEDIAVWWDMNDCPIPEGYDARRVRPSIEGAFKKLGYSGPVSITAYGDQTQTPAHLLRGLSSTGVSVAHTMSESTSSSMFSDMVIWRGHRPPPATMMLISNQVADVFSWDLARLQQHTKYNLFLAYSVTSHIWSVLPSSAEWLWKELLMSSADEKVISSKLRAADFYCKSCGYQDEGVVKFRKHLSSRDHAMREIRNPCDWQLDPITRMWGRNYQAKPEHATAKIAVWWDMKDCPIPEGYDARRVRPSLEGAFKKLGYSGPVSITAYGDQRRTPDQLLRGLSSTGVNVAHTIPDVTYTRMYSDLHKWQKLNPPPATMMLISDTTDDFSRPLAFLQQLTKYNLFLAYSYRPYKMSILVTSAEWLWDSLLADTVSETRTHFLQRCSEEGEESTGMFYCKLCDDCDCKNLDDFRKHLSSKEHALEERRFIESKQLSEYEAQLSREAVIDNFPKSKRLRKTF